MTAPAKPLRAMRRRLRENARNLATATSLLALLVLSVVVVPMTAEAAAGRGPAPVKSIKKAASSTLHAVTKKQRTDRLWRWRKGQFPKAPRPAPLPTTKPSPTQTAPSSAPTIPAPVPSSHATPTPPTPPTPTPSATGWPAPAPAPAPTPTFTRPLPPPVTPTATAAPTTAPSAPAPAPTTAPPAPPAPPAPSGPSGLAMPKGDLPGWKQVFSDDFSGSLSSHWGRYNGQPGGNPAGWWNPSHTYTSGGNLILDGYADGGKNASGGTAAWGATQLTYGKYDVRFRADVGAGYGYVFLLWPASGAWPHDGEIDFAEDGGDDRQSMAATLHYGANNAQVARQLNADFTKWHTIGVEWTPGKLVYTLDGKPWATVTGSMVPNKPMFLALQQAALPCTQWSQCVNSSTPASTKIHIDWVVAYAQSGSTGSGTSTSSALAIGLPLAALAGVSPLLARTRRPSRRRASS